MNQAGKKELFFLKTSEKCRFY